MYKEAVEANKVDIRETMEDVAERATADPEVATEEVVIEEIAMSNRKPMI